MEWEEGRRGIRQTWRKKGRGEEGRMRGTQEGKREEGKLITGSA